MTLFEISRRTFWNGSLGAAILREALRKPFRRLLQNAGIDYAQALVQLGERPYPSGIDVMDGTVKDLLQSGILDPVKVTRTALQNAISVACMVMTTDHLITDEVKDK